MTEERASNSTPNDAPPEEDPRPDGLRSAKSLLLVNTGDGKGKSSAAFGVAMRARARDWPVAVIQFLKSDDWVTGELCRVADAACGGRIVSALEGGYDLDALAASCAAHVAALMRA